MRLGVIGAGQATATLLTELCRGGFDGQITVYHDEGATPCPRPPLSKTPFDRELTARERTLIPEAIASDSRIRWVYESVTALDPDQATITTASATDRFDHLVLATGTRAVKPAIAGLSDADIHVLRSLADRERLTQALANAQRVAVIGAGFMAYELAASLPSTRAITILARGSRGLPQVAQETAAYLIEKSPARTLTHCQVLSAEGQRLETSQGPLAADCVVATIGTAPNVELLLPHGLADADGVPVDLQMHSAHPNLSAIGEVCRHPWADGTGSVRIESIAEANDTATVLAKRLLGESATWCTVPWFWSDQGSEKLQIAGLAQREDGAYLLKSTDSMQVVLRTRGAAVTAVEALNAAREFMAARRLFEKGPLSLNAVLKAGSLMGLFQSSNS